MGSLWWLVSGCNPVRKSKKKDIHDTSSGMPCTQICFLRLFLLFSSCATTNVTVFAFSTPLSLSPLSTPLGTAIPFFSSRPVRIATSWKRRALRARSSVTSLSRDAEYASLRSRCVLIVAVSTRRWALDEQMHTYFCARRTCSLRLCPGVCAS